MNNPPILRPSRTKSARDGEGWIKVCSDSRWRGGHISSIDAINGSFNNSGYIEGSLRTAVITADREIKAIGCGFVEKSRWDSMSHVDWERKVFLIASQAEAWVQISGRSSCLRHILTPLNCVRILKLGPCLLSCGERDNLICVVESCCRDNPWFTTTFCGAIAVVDYYDELMLRIDIDPVPLRNCGLVGFW